MSEEARAAYVAARAEAYVAGLQGSRVDRDVEELRRVFVVAFAAGVEYATNPRSRWRRR